ncbi:MAG: beta-propeller domain-containing protein [Caldimonas sp.]
MSIEHKTDRRQRGATLSLLALVALVATSCGGGSSPGTAPSATKDTALAASQPGELLTYMKSLLLARDAQRQASPGTSLDGPPVPGTSLALSPAGAAVPYSNTTVQETGVDEEDLLKTDGTSVYALDTASLTLGGRMQQQLRVYRRDAAGGIDPAQVLPLPVEPSGYPQPRGLLLAAPAQRAVALSQSFLPITDPLPCELEVPCPLAGAMIYPIFALQSNVQLQFLDLDATGNATLGKHVVIDGQLVASRLIGNVMYLVTTYSPRVPYEQLAAGATAQQKSAVLDQMTSADFLPTWRANTSAAEALVADTDCYVHPSNASFALQVTTITAIDLGSPTLARASRCFVGGTEAIYMAPTSLYLATTRFPFVILSSGLLQYAPQFATDIHKFAVAGMSIDYRASGEVPGNLGWDTERKSYRMGEYNGDLRVLSFTGQTGWVLPEDATSAIAPPPSPATLTVLRESASGASLDAIATLPNSQHPEPLGQAGEQVYAVRFTGARGYLVTFRSVDPLYVLDLSDPSDPRVAGSLQVTGFSDYLFPLTDALLFGVGHGVDATNHLGGVKLGLFDVSDPAQPKVLDTRTVGASSSQSGLDASSHGINWLQVGNVARVGLPMLVTAAPFDPSPQHGLQRIEVDTQAQTLALKAMLPAPSDPLTYPSLWGDRSLQIGSKLVYLTEGQVVVADW